MSFSWWCNDHNGKSLFGEYKIHDQAIGLADDNTPRSLRDVRSAFYDVPYKDKLEDAARDALRFTQSLVMENLRYYTGTKHPECPCCQCHKDPPKSPFGFDIEQARRFISIPLVRVHRAGASI